MFVAAGKVYQVYVLQNPDGRFYIGLSENIQVRLRQHNRGVSKWTVISDDQIASGWKPVWWGESATGREPWLFGVENNPLFLSCKEL